MNGKTLPIERGGGVDQPVMSVAARLVSQVRERGTPRGLCRECKLNGRSCRARDGLPCPPPVRRRSHLATGGHTPPQNCGDVVLRACWGVPSTSLRAGPVAPRLPGGAHRVHGEAGDLQMGRRQDCVRVQDSHWQVSRRRARVVVPCCCLCLFEVTRVCATPPHLAAQPSILPAYVLSMGGHLRCCTHSRFHVLRSIHPSMPFACPPPTPLWPPCGAACPASRDPVVLPFYHSGMSRVLPLGKFFQAGEDIAVKIGESAGGGGVGGVHDPH